MSRISIFFLILISTSSINCHSVVRTKLDPYKKYLDDGTLDGQDWSNVGHTPLSRYHTFLQAFEHFEKINGKVIVELGTTHSFVHGGLEGCDNDNIKYWTPNNPERWDWGAGAFTLMAAECLAHLKPTFYTVDLSNNHLTRCKIMTPKYSSFLR